MSDHPEETVNRNSPSSRLLNEDQTPAFLQPHLQNITANDHQHVLSNSCIPAQLSDPSLQLSSSPSPHFVPVSNPTFPYSTPYPTHVPMMLVPAPVPRPDGSSSLADHQRKALPQSSKPSESSRQTKKIKAPKRKITHEENLLIIDYWKENYEDFMKSNKKEFASRAVQKLCRLPQFQNSQQPPLGAVQLENLINYWLKRYKTVADKFKQSGFGLTEDDPDSLKATGAKLFKYFWEVHEFLACRANVNPPVLLQPRIDKGSTTIDVGKFRSSSNFGPLNVDISNEENEEELLDMVERVENEVSPSEPRKPQVVTGARRPSRGSSKSGRNGAKETGGPAAKKRRTSSGAVVIRDSQNVPDKNPSHGKSNGQSEKEGRNSTGRMGMVSDMLASQITSTEEQNESYARTVAAIEKETDIRSKEVSILEKNATLKVKESEILYREQERKDRQEERVRKDEMRRDQEEKRKEREALRNAIMAKRKMIAEEAEQLRRQADMYMKLDLKEEALKSMKQSEALVARLSEVVEESEE